MGPVVAGLWYDKQCLQDGETDMNMPLFICKGDVRYGCVNILKWINNSEYPNYFNIETSRLAAKHGQLDALIWLQEYECPWNELKCAYI